MTVEAAVVLPLFLFFMLSVLRYCMVMETAVKFGTALSETGKSIAAAAYAAKYAGEDEGLSLAAGALSAVYAQSQVQSRAGDTSLVKNMNMLLSSFQDEMIDLVLTYQVKVPFRVVRLPGNMLIQRARIRSWTGRSTGEDDTEGEDGEDGEEMVYVTATGSVYHEDPDCTHLRLSIRAVDVEALKTLRNSGGAIYHSCEKCGDHTGSTVYITENGNRYHGSLSCSGLKRTVRQVSKDEIGSMRACSKCGTGG